VAFRQTFRDGVRGDGVKDVSRNGARRAASPNPWVGSTAAGAVLAAAAMVVSVVGAIWLTGYFEAFGANRGFLQLVVAIPGASLLTSVGLSFSGMLTRTQMLWAMAPVEGLILAAAGAFGADFVALYWVLVAHVVVFIPWLAGIAAGSLSGWGRSPT
jgi:hypothetical protein